MNRLALLQIDVAEITDVLAASAPLEEGCFIFVALPRPKETPEAILSMARHEVKMQVGNVLLYLGCTSCQYTPPVQEDWGFLKTDAPRMNDIRP